MININYKKKSILYLIQYKKKKNTFITLRIIQYWKF